MQYPHHPKHCDQAQRETPECVNPAEYVQYRTFSALGRLGFGVPTPHHGSPRTSARSGVLPFLGLWKPGIYRAVSLWWAILGAMGRVVRFPPPAASSGPVSPDHPVCHVPSVAGAVEAFFAGRDLAAATCRTYRQALGPLVEAVGGQPVTDLDADQVEAVFEELWADRAPATWNTRRVAVQAFASWCQARWPLASDLLAGVGCAPPASGQHPGGPV